MAPLSNKLHIRSHWQRMSSCNRVSSKCCNSNAFYLLTTSAVSTLSSISIPAILVWTFDIYHPEFYDNLLPSRSQGLLNLSPYWYHYELSKSHLAIQSLLNFSKTLNHFKDKINTGYGASFLIWPRPAFRLNFHHLC